MEHRLSDDPILSVVGLNSHPRSGEDLTRFSFRLIAFNPVLSIQFNLQLCDNQNHNPNLPLIKLVSRFFLLVCLFVSLSSLPLFHSLSLFIQATPSVHLLSLCVLALIYAVIRRYLSLSDPLIF